MNFFKHLHTISKHRRLVRKGCFKLGLYYQGLTHDLSKFSFEEFWIGVKYYQGVRSPNVSERRTIGYSTAWMHHKGRNKHHYEYWTDFSEITNNQLEAVEMPPKYFAEMVVDRIAACKVYKGENYKDSDAYEYFHSRDHKDNMHPNTYKDLEFILLMLSKDGEKKTYEYLKNVYLKKNK